LTRSILACARVAALAAACTFALAGCNYETAGLMGLEPKAMKPLTPELVSLIEQKGMTKQSPILIRIFKEEAEVEVWKQTSAGDYELLKIYPICRWSGELGPKIKEGDRQAPEGFYAITPGLMNPRSNYYLAFNLGYPNAYDRVLGRSGALLMVHGDCSSRGCYAMTDEQIGEIFALARDSFEAGQQSFQVQAYPFRMTPENLAKHRNSPHLAFWKMLKEGNDHFLLSKQEPKVDVCGKKYVFNAIPFDPARPFDAARPCPPIDQAFEVAQAVSQKRDADEREYAALVSRGIATLPVITGRDGGMHPVFAAAIERKRMPQDDQRVIAAAPVPGSVPATTRPPSEDLTASTPEGPSVIPATATPASRPGIFARWFGGTEVRSAPPAPAPAAVPTPQPRPQTVAAPPRKPQPPAPAEEKDKPAPPALMPGSTPIVSSGGFSFR
jgi:murein L,D-transpeptidase YafK